MPAVDARPRRLAPDARREQILEAARATVAANGLQEFSLEEVARAAGVAASLPRHYFGSRDGLLLAVATQIIEEVVALLGAPRGGPTLTQRLGRYLDVVERDPWVHDVWMRSAERSPELHERVSGARRHLAELSFGTRWEDLDSVRRLALVGWAGYFESVVSGWLQLGIGDRDAVVATLADAARRLGVEGV